MMFIFFFKYHGEPTIKTAPDNIYL